MFSGRVRRTPEMGGNSADRRSLARFLNLILAASFVAALTIPAMTWDAADGGWWGMDQVDRSEQPKNWPTWETHSRPGFEDIATKPAEVIPSRLLVVKLDGSVVGMSLDEAFARNGNDSRADDVWTVGWRA